MSDVSSPPDNPDGPPVSVHLNGSFEIQTEPPPPPGSESALENSFEVVPELEQSSQSISKGSAVQSENSHIQANQDSPLAGSLEQTDSTISPPQTQVEQNNTNGDNPGPVEQEQSLSHNPDTNNDNRDKDDDEDDDKDEDEDDDYDPESFMSVPDKPKESETAPAAEALLQSVLSEFGNKAGAQNQSQPNSKDLHKILSELEPSSSNPASSSPITSSAAPSSSGSSTTHQKSESLPKREKKFRELNLDAPQTPEEARAFELFLQDENEYVSGGKWDRFPYGSRLFVGNLPTDRLEKWQLYRIFAVYGPIAQISMKSAYGFVQFKSPESCTRAIENDQGLPVKGDHLLLQMSKPQQDSGTNNGGFRRDRSRSPPPNRRAGTNDPRGRNNRRDRSPPGYRGGRSPPRGVRTPEVMIFLLDRLDRGYINYVESGFRNAHIRFEVEAMFRRGSLSRAIQQLAYEGVSAVLTLDNKLQRQGTVNLQVFEQGADGNVRFDEYLKIELHAAVDLVIRAKRNRHSTKSQPPQSSMPTKPSQNYYGTDPNTANLMSTLQNMDPASLQRVVATIQQQHQQPPAMASQAPAPMYGGIQGYWGNMPTAQATQAAYSQAAAYGQMYNQAVPPQQQQQPPPSNAPGQSTVQVQNIMDQLARLQGQQK